MRLILVLTFALVSAACSASTVEPAPNGAGGFSAGDGGGGSGGQSECANTCDANERCYVACGGLEAECGFGNITCGEHDMGACGCDGNAYETLCDMDQAGIRQGAAGSCTPPQGQFACGPLLCRAEDQLCRITGSSPYCFSRDPSCADCSCIDLDEECLSSTGTCVIAEGGGIIVTCN